MEISKFIELLLEPAFIVGLLTLVVPFVVYMVQQQSRSSQFFHECAKSLFWVRRLERTNNF